MHDLAINAEVSCRSVVAFLEEIERQPDYHAMADKAADFYDGNQTDPHVKEILNKRDQPDFAHNLIGPAIDGVCGLEAKMRTDWVVLSDSDAHTDVADALTHKLLEAKRMTRADRAISDAYKAQVVTGIGWVEVSRNSDPFKYDYRVNYVHRHEIFFDWDTREPDFSDCRWMLRHKLLEKDQLLTLFPKHKDLIESLAGTWADKHFDIDTVLMRSADLIGDMETVQTCKAQLSKWMDVNNRKVRVYEVYYRHFIRKTVLKTRDGGVFDYDPKNAYQAAAIAEGIAKVFANVPTSKMRKSFFIGPFRIADMDSDHPHDKYPYVPFIGYREDRTGIPYGIVRRMIPAQEEINVRRRKLTMLLNKVTVTKDDDAVNNMHDDDLLDELYRQASVINLNPNRLNKGKGIDIEWGNTSISEQQFKVMQESRQLIQDTGGIYGAFLGQETNAASGVAINSLVEQGTVTLSEINDNYRFSKQLVGELLLAHIVQDIGTEEQQVALYADDKSKKTKIIKLNSPEVEDGRVVRINNSVVTSRARVTVADASSAPGYRQHMAAEMMRMMGQLPPEYQAALIPLMIEMTDLPNRHDAIRAIKEATGGVAPEDMTPEQLQAAEEQKAEEQKLKLIEIQRLAGEAEKIVAEAGRINAQTALTDADRAKRMAEVREVEARIKKLVTEVVQIRASVQNEIAARLNDYGGPDGTTDKENEPASAGFFSP